MCVYGRAGEEGESAKGWVNGGTHEEEGRRRKPRREEQSEQCILSQGQLAK